MGGPADASRATWTAALATLLVAATWAPPAAQSLADVARAEAARRAALARSGPTLTNKDLKSAAGATPPSAAAGDAAGMTTGSPAGHAEEDGTPALEPTSHDNPAADGKPAPAPEKRDETYWRARFQATRGAVTRAEQEAAAVEARIARLDADLASHRSEAIRAEAARERESAAAALRQLQRRLGNLREELAVLEQLARTLDVPSDWTR